MDLQRLLAGIVSVVAGLVLLSRFQEAGFSPAALITGLAFLAFGVYRLNMAVRRYRDYRSRSLKET